MRRLPALGFAALAVMSVAAFFLTQHLKTAKPLVWGYPSPVPSVFDPVAGRVCRDDTGQRLNYRQTDLPVALAYEPDSVAVYVRAASAEGPIVATLSTGTAMRTTAERYAARESTAFPWDGRRTGGALASPGTYIFEIVLQHQDRQIYLTKAPVHLITSAHPPDHGCLAAVK